MNKFSRNAIKLISLLPENKGDYLNNPKKSGGFFDLSPIDWLWVSVCIGLSASLIGLTLW